MAQEIRRLTFAFRRSASDRTLVEGIAYLALDPPASLEVDEAEARLRIDSWGTWMRRDVLEKFAHDFLTYGRAVDAHHDHGPVGNVVESYLTGEASAEYPPHVWVVKARVHDAATLAEIDAGELTGFSIEFLSALKVRTLLVGGAQVRTGEIVTPVPIFLSLVKDPAIGQPFASIERRSAAPSGAVRELDEETGRVTRMWRCAMPTENDPKAPSTPTAPDAPPASVIDAPLDPQAATRSAPEPVTAVPALATEVAKAASGPTALRRAAEEALGTERCLEIQQRAEGGSFTEAWAVLAPRAATWAMFWEAIYLLESVVRNIRWSVTSDAEQYAAVNTACEEFSDAIGAIAAAGGVTVAMRSAEQRATARLTKATVLKLSKVRANCKAAVERLDDLLDDEDDDAKEVSAKGAPAAEDEAEVAARSARDAELATLRTRALEAEAGLATKGTELDAARAALAEATAAQQRAEARATELESRRPAPQSRTPQGDGEGGEAAQKRSGGGWNVFRRPAEED